jgi:ribonuclease-3
MKKKKMDLEKIEETLGVTFRDKAYLKRAFTHRSYLNENQDVDKHNERLEYLGDAVLEFLVSKFLFKNYPDRAEGDLTSFRSATVKTGTLAETGNELNFGEYLRMSRGEEKTGGRHKEYLLANTFEAVIGAMYLDSGIRKTEAFLNRILFPKIETIVKNRLDIDPKTRFQELAQDHEKVTPTYELLSEKGPDHNKEFTMAVYLGSTEYGRGTGPSKQRAEEEAAKRAVQKITDQISSRKSTT